MIRYFFLLMFTITVSGAHLHAQTDRKLAFGDQEHVIYKLYYNWKFVWIPAGEVSFTTHFTEDYIDFDIKGQSYPSYDSFFKVRDRYESRICRESHKPLYFIRDIEEGNYIRYDSIDFDWAKSSAKEYFGTNRRDFEIYDFDTHENMLDLISSIYTLRNTDIKELKLGDEIKFEILFDKEIHNIRLRSNGFREKKIKSLGKINCLHLELELLDGHTFNEGDKMHIWVSNDGNRLPLMIESPVSVGSVKAILKHAENLIEEATYQTEE